MKKFLLAGVLFLIVGYSTAQIVKIGGYWKGDHCVSSTISATRVFLNESTGSNPLSTQWKIIDPSGGTITLKDTGKYTPMEYALVSVGTYTVIMTVEWSNQTKHDTARITTYANPEFSFYATSPDVICPSEGISFAYTMTPPFTQGMVSSVFWEFGDGGSSTSHTPTHPYNNGPNKEIAYNVSLRVTDVNGCETKITMPALVFVHAKPEVAFTADQTDYCFNKNDVSQTRTPIFTNQTDANNGGLNNNTYVWDFGDGSPTSTAVSGPHTYNAGSLPYNVSLQATNQYGCVNTLTKYSYISVRKLDPQYQITGSPVCEIPGSIYVEGFDPSVTYRWTISPSISPVSQFQGQRGTMDIKGTTKMGEHNLTLKITDQTDPNCYVEEVIQIYFYDKKQVTYQITANDTNECDPSHAINFANTTPYPWQDDLGYGETWWDFGDGNIGGPANTISHTYGDYGDYTVKMYGTTPYGCAIDEAVFQGVHLFKLRGRAVRILPGQTDPKDGCAPWDVGFANYRDSLVSSSEIDSFIWILNYHPYTMPPVFFPNLNLEPDSMITRGGAADSLIYHTYLDTGRYYVYYQMINKQGCISEEIYVDDIKVGYPPISNFTFIPDTQCKPMISIRVEAYDSVIVDCMTGDTILVANSRANGWQWLDDNDSPIGAPSKSSTISPGETGSVYVNMKCSHNGCESEIKFRKEDMGYACPPIAKIQNPTKDSDGNDPLYCKFPTISFEWKGQEETEGAMRMRWYAGDFFPPAMARPMDDKNPTNLPTDTNRQSVSGMIWLDTNSFTVIRDSMIITCDNQTLICDTVYTTFTTGSKTYLSYDTTVTGGNWTFTYSDTVHGVYSDYLTKSIGTIYTYLWAVNDSSMLQDTIMRIDSVHINDTILSCPTKVYVKKGDSYPPGVDYKYEHYHHLSDTIGSYISYATTTVINKDTVIEVIEPLFPEFFNPCGYCEHTAEQLIYISVAKMNLVTSGDNFCMGDPDGIMFFDSSYCNVGIMGWGFKIEAVPGETNMGNLEDWMMKDIPLGTMYPIENYRPMPSDHWTVNNGGQWIHFARPNVYRAVLVDSCALKCSHPQGEVDKGKYVVEADDSRTDTVVFRINPKSVPAYTSSKDSITFASGRADTICINSKEKLYLKDASWSPFPFDTAKITGWEWRIGSLKDTNQNPALTVTTAASHDIYLTVTNEFGCDSMIMFDNRVLATNVVASYSVLGGAKQCNKQDVVFNSDSRVMPENYNTSTYLRLVYDWGDGTDTTIYAFSGHRPSIKHRYDYPNLQTKVPVKLTVTILSDSVKKIPIGCESEYVDTITILRPLAGFTDDGHLFPCPNEGNVEGRTITFTDTSQGSIVSIEWQFGDGTYTKGPLPDPSLEKPVKTYTKAGKYDILLVVHSDAFNGSCIDSLFLKEYVVISGPKGYFTHSESGKCRPVSIDFYPFFTDTTELGAYIPDTVEVLAQDGQIHSADGKNVTKIISNLYNTAGVYYPIYKLIKSVTFNNQTERCEVEIRDTNPIYVIDLQPNFATDPLYCPDIPIMFDNTSKWEPAVLPHDSVAWNFGNGDISQNYSDSTTYTPGKYPVLLTMRIMQCTRTKSANIEVMEIPNVYTFPDTAQACDGLDVKFWADSLLDISRISSYEWVFDDGTTLEGNPVFREFTTSGKYPYGLMLTFTPKNCFREYLDTVTIFAYKSPVADFEADPEVGIVDQTFVFTDKSTVGDGRLVKWFWEFGDGTTSPDSVNSRQEHIYTTTSGYTPITLFIEDEHGCKAKTKFQVLIQEKLGFPNIFTPNGNCVSAADGSPIKCRFRPMEDKGFFREFKHEIYDRWGMLVWKKSQCKDPNCPPYQSEDFWWDATNTQGAPVANGVYYWVVYATPLSGAKPFILNGSVTVVGQ